jgi:RNA polymerase sigma-70 factor (ECF subfamily)
MKTDEQRLVALAQLGDNSAFQELYRMNKEKIFKLSYQYTRNKQDAEDLMQDIFYRAFISIKKFKAHDNARFSTWLYRIGINTSINFSQRKKMRVDHHTPNDYAPLEATACKKPNPEEAAAMNDMQERLESGIDSLSPRQRMIFVLKNHQGLKIREIADHMNCSEGSIKKQLSRAVASLMKKLSMIPNGEHK